MSDLTYLINPSERDILTTAGDRQPLGLLYIASCLEKHGHTVKVYDMNHRTQSELLQGIRNDQPNMIGISCLTSPMVNETKSLLRYVKANSDARIIVGGYHPTIMPDDFKGLVDNVVTGEGEYAAECLINGVLDKPVLTNGFTNLEGLIPARHLVNSSEYNMNMDGMRTGTMITSRGCPNNCVFCGNQTRRVRYHDLESISKELDYMKKEGYSAVYFLDDVFTINKKRAIDISKMCKDRDLKFRVTTRANYIDEPMVAELAHNGLDIASMGVESGNEYILWRVGKNQTKDHIREAVKICANSDVKTKGFFILGLPGETERTAQQTIKFAEELQSCGMEYCDFYPLVPFPGTVIWANPSQYGIRVIDTDYSNYLQATKGEPKIVCETINLKAERIGQLLKEAKERTRRLK